MGKLWFWPVAFGAATGLAIRLIFQGDTYYAYNVMMASFTVLVPITVGAITIYVAERIARRSWSYYFWVAALANTLFVISTFVMLIEGLICTILAVPLFGLIGGVAGLVTGAVCRHFKRPRRTVLSVAALPLLLGAVEQHLPLPDTIDTVTSSRFIDASPEQIWQVLMEARDIRPEEIGSAWMYRIGVPLPLHATTEVRDGERVRHIAMGKGIRFEQVVVDWQPQRRVEWSYRFTPDSFPPQSLDDHVRIGGAHFDLHRTSYSLQPYTLGPGENGTLVTAEMTYRVSTHFNWYARPVARWLIGNFERHALRFYAGRAADLGDRS